MGADKKVGTAMVKYGNRRELSDCVGGYAGGLMPLMDTDGKPVITK